MKRLLTIAIAFIFPIIAFAQQGELANKQVGFPELNDTSTGTVLHGTATITALGTAIAATTSNTGVPTFIVVGNAGTSGRAALGVNGYLAQCTMDTTTSNTGGFYVINSTTQNNHCHAQLAQPAAGIWIIGFMADGATANGGLANVTVNGQFVSSGGGGGAVSSVFGRTGAVVSAIGDYTFSQIGGAVINSQLPGSGITLINSVSCALGSICTIPITGTTTINTVPCVLGSSCTISTGGVPTLPTTVNLVPWVLSSFSSSGVGQPAAWTLQGATGNVISGATSTYTFCGAITGVGACTAISDNVNFPQHDSAASSRLTLTLPTPTTLQIPNFITSYCNNSQVTLGNGDTIVPTTWTINLKSNLAVFPGVCYRISVDPFVANNWLAVSYGSANSGKLYLENFPSTAGHFDIQACINAAVTQHKICSTLNLAGATVNPTVQLDLGDTAGAGAFGALELSAGFTISSTATTGCAFKHWHGFYIFGPGVPYNSAIFLMNGTASGLTAIWCTDGGGGATAYYEGSNFQVKNTTASNPVASSGYSVEINGFNDSSFYRDVEFFDYTNKIVHITHSCCSSGLYNVVIDGNYTSGTELTLEYLGSGVSDHGFGLGQMSIDHPATTASHVVCHDTASPPHTTFTFYGPLYLENTTGTPAQPTIDINGCGVANFDLIDGGNAAIVPVIQIENVGTPLVSFRAMSSSANGTAVNDLVTGGTGTTLLDANGHAGPFTNGTGIFGGVTILGKPAPRTIASGALTLNTTAVGSGACGTAQTATATGTLTTDRLVVNFNGDPTAVTGYVPLVAGMLTIIPYPTANTVNIKVCNLTTSSITPGAVTLNWMVLR